MKYYLALNGVAGDSLDKEHEGWFEVSGFDLGVESEVSLGAGSGASVSKAVFNPLNINLLEDTGIVAALDGLVGGALKGATLKGVSDDGATVYNIDLGNIYIQSVADTDGAGLSLSVVYGAIEISTNAPDASGALLPPVTAGYDLEAGKQATIPSTTPSGVVPGVTTIKYFIEIDGITGDSSTKGFDGWFEIGSFNFGGLNPATFGLGGGHGVASFDDLQISLTNNAGLAAFVEKSATGKALKGTHLVGVVSDEKGDLKKVYDLSTKDTYVTLVRDASGNDGFDVALAYSAISLKTKDLEGNITQDFGWDVANIKSISSFDASIARGGINGGGTEAVQYFLAIDGVAGNSLDADHKGWFEVTGFDWGVSNTVTLAAGGGGSTAGKALFDIVDLQIEGTQALPTLTNRLVTGKSFGFATLQGVDANGKTVYNLDLGSVFVNKAIDNSEFGVDLSLSYSQIEIADYRADKDGKLAGLEEFGWDLKTAKSSSVNSATNITYSDGSNANRYYMKIEGLNGGSVDANHKGWFEVEDFNFNIEGGPPVGGSLGGVFAKATHGDVNVELASNTGLTALINLAATGKILSNGITIEGVTKGGSGSSLVVYDLVLENVLVSEVADDPSGMTVSFDFSRYSLQTKGIDAKGGTATPLITSYDFETGKAGTSTLAGPASPVTPAIGSGEPTTYYLAIDGLNGDSNDAAHKGWFEVSSLNFSLDNTGSSVGGASGVGKAVWTDVSIQLVSDTALAPLAARMAQVNTIKVATLQAMAPDGKTVAYNLDLSDVVLHNLSESQGQGFTIGLDYKSIELEVMNFDVLGKAVGITSVLHDRVDAKTTTGTSSSLASATPGAVGDVVAPVKYFMLVDGLNGGSLDAKHKGWFEISDFSFDMQNTTSATSAGGAGLGKTSFGQLTLHTETDTALSNFLLDVATGKSIKGVKIEGVSGGVTPIVSYDLTLGNVFVTKVNDAQGQGYDLSLFYGGLQLKTIGVDAKTGAAGDVSVFNWDLSKNAPTFTPPTIKLNEAPVAITDSYNINEDATLVVAAANAVTVNDISDDGKTASFITGVSHGSLTFNSNGTFTYTPFTNYSGTDSFTYSITDGVSWSNATAVTLTINPVNDAPVADDDTYATSYLTALNISAGTGVLNGDTDVDGGALTAVLNTGPSKGTLTLNSNGSFVYTPFAGAIGVDTFTYTAVDPGNLSDLATVSITINPSSSPTLNADYLVGDSKDNTISGLAGDDLISGGLGDDQLFGDGDNDTLIGGGHTVGGYNFLDGGDGSDTADYSSETASVYIELRSPAGYVLGPSGYVLADLMTSVENANGGSGDDVIYGNEADANRLAGNAGSDSIFGLGGNDTLIGGDATIGGYNFLSGGEGSDTASYEGMNQSVYADIGIGGAWINSPGGFVFTDYYNSIENLTGGSAADYLFGSAIDNTISGGQGDDQLYGNDGNDVLRGGGHTVGGYNYLSGGAGNDTADYSRETAGVYVDLAQQAAWVLVGGSYVFSDILNSVENVTGGSGADVLLGTEAAANRLLGNAGSDVIFALGGDDILVGGTADPGGYNYLLGGTGSDTASYEGITLSVFADLNSPAAWTIVGGSYVFTDYFDSIENLTGGEADDTLIGTAGANTLEGGGGGDVMFANGGGGVDGQSDVFVFRRSTDSLVTDYDQLFGFQTGSDKLDFGDMNITAANVAIDHLAGVSVVYADADGLIGYEFAIVLQGNSTVTTADILFT